VSRGIFAISSSTFFFFFFFLPIFPILLGYFFLGPKTSPLSSSRGNSPLFLLLFFPQDSEDGLYCQLGSRSARSFPLIGIVSVRTVPAFFPLPSCNSISRYFLLIYNGLRYGVHFSCKICTRTQLAPVLLLFASQLISLLCPCVHLENSHTASFFLYSWKFNVNCPPPFIFSSILPSHFFSSKKRQSSWTGPPPSKEKQMLSLFFFFPSFSFSLFFLLCGRIGKMEYVFSPFPKP